MDSRNEQNGYYPPQGDCYYQPCRSEQKSAFATASMVLGILSLCSLITVYWALPIGALAILFVILSKRRGNKMAMHALIGLSTSLTSMIISFFILLTSAIFFFQMMNPENREYADSLFQSSYGYGFNEYMQNYLDKIEQTYGKDASDSIRQLFGIE